jgi:hypothetical protein
MIRIQQIIATIIILGSAAAIIAGSDRYFPFSNYPMYSKLFITPGVYTSRGVLGIGADGSETRLDVANLLSPFWNASFREALLVHRSESEIRSKLLATLDWYNRQAEKNTAERLIALRLYRYEIPWNELTEATLNQRSLEKVFQDHATVLIEVKP